MLDRRWFDTAVGQAPAMLPCHTSAFFAGIDRVDDERALGETADARAAHVDRASHIMPPQLPTPIPRRTRVVLHLSAFAVS